VFTLLFFISFVYLFIFCCEFYCFQQHVSSWSRFGTAPSSDGKSFLIYLKLDLNRALISPGVRCQPVWSGSATKTIARTPWLPNPFQSGSATGKALLWLHNPIGFGNPESVLSSGCRTHFFLKILHSNLTLICINCRLGFIAIPRIWPCPMGDLINCHRPVFFCTIRLKPERICFIIMLTLFFYLLIPVSCLYVLSGAFDWLPINALGLVKKKVTTRIYICLIPFCRAKNSRIHVFRRFSCKWYPTPINACWSSPGHGNFAPVVRVWAAADITIPRTRYFIQPLHLVLNRKVCARNT